MFDFFQSEEEIAPAKKVTLKELEKVCLGPCLTGGCIDGGTTCGLWE